MGQSMPSMPRIFRPERSSASAGEPPATGPHTPPESPITSGQGAPAPAPTDSRVATDSRVSASNPQALHDRSPDGQQRLSQAPSASPGFAEQGRMRRRMRFLRKARELAYRDLGGLVFDLYRFGQRHDELVSAKLGALALLDAELRSIEHALNEHRGVTVLREAGVAACPRCAAVHSSADRFCPSCGMPIGRHAERPIAAGPVAAPAPSVPRPAPAVATPATAHAPAVTIKPAAAAPTPTAPAPAVTAASPTADSRPTAPVTTPAAAAQPPAAAPRPAPPNAAPPASPPAAGPPAATPPAGQPATRAPANTPVYGKQAAAPPDSSSAVQPPAPRHTAAKPIAAAATPSKPKKKTPTSAQADEDQPTEIVRPPATGA
jgi:hypothetical protein